MTGCPVIDFADPKIQRDPFPAYEALRAKGPVHRDPTTGYYVVVDYDLNLEIVRDVETYSNETGVIAVRSGDFGKEIQKVYEEHGVPVQPTLLVTDPPRHRFYRSFVDRAFSPSRVKKLEAYLTEVCDEMIAEFANESEIDFIARMAAILPVYVVADLVGADRSMVSSLKLWADAAASGTDPSSPREAVLGFVREECKLQLFILEQANRYRAQPADTLLSDVANAKVDGRHLSDEELVSMMEQVFNAGHETTSGVLGHAMMWMIKTPGLEEQLREKPELIGAFVEEILRLEAPLQGMFRITTRDVTLGGMDIPKGAVIMVRFGAANRDDKKFGCPAQIDLTRPGLRQHFAFGSGIHFCVGNQLARAELRIAFTRLLHHLRDFRLTDESAPIERRPHYFIHGLERLNIQFSRNLT